ncbi:hypothetical protein BAUCODRAFT_28789 [Baudoinia panamericana UAMH 10762]|uniref:Major facilitator superfamily (MFS) profile domain-containing protein n=1 Tax=Baudoinia panamericana (strain UAMH 10762) TaxID=717646 RepID=M2M0B0_BAUPA|nr:uncharacterized protein BAUCODRAFT_28789 [Baudoinia panamericana UAMH 10762]EMD00433.1 hypothetical protein BAUCODRAFT_28789 [Baudoinia panamericana UAMH 10762]
MPFGVKLICTVAALMLGVLCMALDNTIIAVAIPRITDTFGNLNDVGWYASAYLLPGCAFQLLAGKLYTYLSIKWVFLTALFIFEVGSLVCGVAPTSTALIVGRAIAGLGSAGIFSGAMVTIAHIVELEKRPVYFSLIGGVYGLASVIGPLIGGAFTDKVTWRWCFYVNLPIGAVTAILLVVFLRLKPHDKSTRIPLRALLWKLDPIGSTIFVPSIVCVILALQMGGVTYAWSNGRIIALWVVFAVTLIAFCILQWVLRENATVPLRIARQRSIAFASLFGFCIGASFFIFIYFVPIWFQAIKGTSAVQAGIYTLPLILAEILGIGLSGGLVTNLGYFAPFFIGSSVIMSIGAGLMMLFDVNTSTGRWVGYQFLYGFGVGLGFQQGGVAAQAALPFKDVAVGTTVVLFLQILGGSLFVSVAQNLFTTHLIKNILALGLADLNPADIVAAGATGIRSLVSEAELPAVLGAYNKALVTVFEVGTITAAISILGAVGVEWRSIKAEKKPVIAAEEPIVA